jgi:PAS domain S-box-containing protein
VPESLIDLAGLKVGAEDFLVAVLETIAQPIWVVDPDGVIRFANPAAIAALGHDSAEELSGRRSHETIHHSHPDGTPYPAADCPMLLPRATGETVTSDLDWFFRRDGSMFPVSYISVPLEMRDGRGAVVAFTDIEDRLRAERELQERDQTLAAQLASLRRLATLVADGAASADVFAAVAGEVASLLKLPVVEIARYDSDGTATVIGASSDRPQPPFESSTRWPLDGPSISTLVKQTARPARRDDPADLRGAIADAARARGLRSGAGAPIIVDGRVWGVMATCGSEGEPLPDHVEDRLAEFAALIAAAFSNTTRRDELARLADEQAALRRVATLVARGVPPPELFDAVAEEVGRLLEADLAGMIRYVSDDAVAPVATWAAEGLHPEVKGQWPLEGDRIATTILTTRRPAREDDWAEVGGPIAAFVLTEMGVRSSVGSPIVVQGQIWGALFVHSKRPDQPLPRDTESRVTNFAELVATAISNAEARGQVSQLAEEHAALRRVATLVAEGAAPTEVFDAVIVEVANLLGAAQVGLSRYESQHEISVLAIRGQDPAVLRAGMRLPLDGDSLNARILRTGRSVRLNFFEQGSGTIAEVLRRNNVNATVGAPIVVEATLWGMIGASWKGHDPPPVDAEDRLAQFAELLATAIANADSRDQLTASRARLLTAGDEARRRLVRDLHDGAQQRLIHAIVTLKLAQRALSEDGERLESLLADALDHAEQGNAELRELAHGILPSVLTRGGLRAGVDSLVSRLDLPVDVDVTSTRLSPELEASSYFIVAEGLTNVIKHAQATRAEVTAAAEGGMLSLEVRDDGIGGADPDGHGLVGMSDRVAALGGRLRINSPGGGGTIVAAELPLPA